MWSVPKLWRGGDCYIIGGGPSLTNIFDIPDEVVHAVTSGSAPMTEYSPYLSPIQDKHTIAVNSAYKLGLWVDICFFGDDSWYISHRKSLAQWTKLKVSCAPWFSTRKGNAQEGVKYLPKDKKRNGITLDPTRVVWGAHSGCGAINLAVHLGVHRIYLIGFDMRLDENKKSHWHFDYNTSSKNPPFRRHLQAYPAIAGDAKELGVEIINLNPKSAINVFPFGRPPWKNRE